MKKARFFILILSFFCLLTESYSQDYHIRIGVIGNSITQGTSSTTAYPAQLGELLEAIYGDTCIVTNYGRSATTMLKNGDYPYWVTQQLKDYLSSAPELCFLMLGTNDTKSSNWNNYGEEFISDYLSMIDTILERNPFTKFMLGYPPPAFSDAWGIRNEIIVSGIIPAINSVLTLRDAESVDFYHAFLDSAHLFPDGIHPNVEGEAIMAQMIFDKMMATNFIESANTGLASITSFKTGETPLQLDESTILSWTTINADTVLLNGQIVNIDGSIEISPSETTVYTLIAKGEIRNDTMQLTQEVYYPTAQCQNITVYLDGTGNAGITSDDVNGSVSGNSGVASMELNQYDFDCNDLGNNQVTLTLEDTNGTITQCTATVTVVDTISPTAVCKDITVYLDETGGATLDSLALDNGSSDNCSLAFHELDISNFACSDVGDNTVIMTVTNTNGETDQCTATVTVEDTISATAVCKDITVFLDETGSATLDSLVLDNGSSDNCSLSSHTLDVSNFNCSDVGANTVTMTVTNANNSSSSCSSIVMVQDTVSPTAQCKDVGVQLDANGNASITASEVDNQSYDNCGIASMSIAPSVFTFDNIVENTVTLTVTDVNGNSNTCTAKVTIDDNIPPVIQCNPQDIYLNDDGTYILSTSQIRAFAEGATDNVDDFDDLDVTVSRRVFNCSQIGEALEAKVTVTDQAGNVSTCWADITVHPPSLYQIDPVDDVEVEAEIGECGAAISYPDFINDNCATFIQIAGMGPDTIFPIGTTTETWEMTDMNGNEDTISFNVIVTTVNTIPTLDSIADVDTTEDAEIIVELRGISYGNDCLAQEVTITAESSNTELIKSIIIDYVSGDSTAILKLIPSSDMSDSTEITVRVEDEMGASISKSFKVKVNPVNDPPFVVSPIVDQVVNASYELKIPVSSVLGEFFDDIDDTTLTITAMEEGQDTLPNWTMLAEDTLYATPALANIGCVGIVVQATDIAGAMAADTFSICVEGYPVGVGDIGAGIFKVTMYPNPTGGIVNLDIKTTKAQEVKLTVMDIAGRAVLQKQFSVAETIRFDMSDKGSGLYFVQLNIVGSQVIKKLTVDHK